MQIDKVRPPAVEPLLRIGWREDAYSPTSQMTIPLLALRRHVCVLGRTGSGKSVTGMVLTHELLKHGIPTVVLDRTGEFASAFAGVQGVKVYRPGENLTVSPFSRSGRDIGDDVERAVSLMEHYLRATFNLSLTPLQARTFREALARCYAGGSLNISNLIDELRQAEKRTMQLKGWVESTEAVVSRLYPFASGTMGRVFEAEAEVEPAAFFEPGVHVFDLGALQTDEGRNLLSQVVCRLVMDRGRDMGRTDALRLVLVVDEAHHIAPNQYGYQGMLERYAIELRKYGMGLLVMATRPTQVSENIMANCNAIVCHSLTSGKDVDLALNYMVNRLEADRFMSDLRLLDVGECLVQLNDKSTQVLAKCKIGLPEHGFLLAKPNRESALAREPTGPHEPGSAPHASPPAENDSAWEVYEKLPAWARQAASTVAGLGGTVRVRLLAEKGYSRRQLKQMARGPHQILAVSGTTARLTSLGWKTVTVGEALQKGT